MGSLLANLLTEHTSEPCHVSLHSCSCRILVPLAAPQPQPGALGAAGWQRSTGTKQGSCSALGDSSSFSHSAADSERCPKPHVLQRYVAVQPCRSQGHPRLSLCHLTPTAGWAAPGLRIRHPRLRTGRSVELL